MAPLTHDVSFRVSPDFSVEIAEQRIHPRFAQAGVQVLQTRVEEDVYLRLTLTVSGEPQAIQRVTDEVEEQVGGVWYRTSTML